MNEYLKFSHHSVYKNKSRFQLFEFSFLQRTPGIDKIWEISILIPESLFGSLNIICNHRMMNPIMIWDNQQKESTHGSAEMKNKIQETHGWQTVVNIRHWIIFIRNSKFHNFQVIYPRKLPPGDNKCTIRQDGGSFSLSVVILIFF